MSTRRPVIISCALTGAGESFRKSPAVPITPAQIADQAIAAAQAGAAIVHVHVRDPATGLPSSRIELYAEVVERIRNAHTGVLINLTTGPGTMVDVSPTAPLTFGPIPHEPLMAPAERVAHVLALRPDICSLDVATMNMGEYAFVNVSKHLRAMAALIRSAGVLPELEVFDLGHVRLASHLIAQGDLELPGYFQLCMGVTWGAPATPEALALMRSLLPDGATWSAFGVGREQFPMVAAAATLGGNVRVGLEDNLYLEPGRLAQNNAELVAKAARIVRDLGFEVATPQDALSSLKPH